MGFNKLMSLAFGAVFIVILYVIIYYALKIMYKDVKTGNKKRINSRKAHGLEVVETVAESELKPESIIPIRGAITIGRKEDNSIVLNDQFVSSHHAKLFVRNDEFYLEDLGSTNGTYVNDNKIQGRIRLKVEDEIRLGSTIFKVID